MGCVLGAVAPSVPGGASRGSSPASLDGCVHPGRAPVSVLGGAGGPSPSGRARAAFPVGFDVILFYKRKVFKTSNILAQPSAQVSKDRRAGGQQMAVR